MGLEALVPLLMGAILSISGKVGEGVLDAVQESAQSGALAVMAKIKAWWSADTSASDDLAKFEKEPNIYEPVIEARLVQKLSEEPAKVPEFAALLTSMGPETEVFQKIANGHGITGAKVQQILHGRVKVVQEIRDATDVVGVDINKMGGQG